METNLGLVFNHIGPSQAAFYGINFVNHWVSDIKNPATIFVQNLTDPCIPVQTAIMEMTEIIDFRGNIICTTVDQAHQILNMPNPSPKYFYVWDLEWLRENKDFEYHMQVMRNPKIDLISRSHVHSNMIEKYCNRRPILSVEDFNFRELLNGKTKKERSST